MVTLWTCLVISTQLQSFPSHWQSLWLYTYNKLWNTQEGPKIYRNILLKEKELMLWLVEILKAIIIYYFHNQKRLISSLKKNPIKQILLILPSWKEWSEGNGRNSHTRVQVFTAIGTGVKLWPFPGWSTGKSGRVGRAHWVRWAWIQKGKGP